MINKTLRKATAERHGPVVVVRYTGGGDCLWLNMYLDCEHGQMTCDSDIGSYSYNFGRCVRKGDDFLRFCTELFAKEEWLLRKCIDDKCVPKKFMLLIIVDWQRPKSKRIIEGIAERTWSKCVHLKRSRRGLRAVRKPL